MLGGGIYPGMITATVGTALLIAVVAHVDRDRAAPAALRVVVRRPPARLRGDRARVVPPDPDRQRARARHDRGRLLARRSTSRRSRCSSSSASSPRSSTRSATGCASPRSSRRGRASSRSGSPAAASTGCARAPGQFFLWRFLTPRPLVERASVLALGGARRAVAAHHREGARRPQRRARRRPAGHARRRRGAVRRLHRRERAAATRSLLIAGGIGITPIRALLEEMHGDVVVLYRVVSDDDIVFRDELERLARRARHRPCTSSSATTRRAEGRDLLVAGAPARARPRHRRARRLPLRAARR